MHYIAGDALTDGVLNDLLFLDDCAFDIQHFLFFFECSGMVLAS
jgi:hypothetical protein